MQLSRQAAHPLNQICIVGRPATGGAAPLVLNRSNEAHIGLASEDLLSARMVSRKRTANPTRTCDPPPLKAALGLVAVHPAEIAAHTPASRHCRHRPANLTPW